MHQDFSHFIQAKSTAISSQGSVVVSPLSKEVASFLARSWVGGEVVGLQAMACPAWLPMFEGSGEFQYWFGLWIIRSAFLEEIRSVSISKSTSTTQCPFPTKNIPRLPNSSPISTYGTTRSLPVNLILTQPSSGPVPFLSRWNGATVYVETGQFLPWRVGLLCINKKSWFLLISVAHVFIHMYFFT